MLLKNEFITILSHSDVVGIKHDNVTVKCDVDVTRAEFMKFSVMRLKPKAEMCVVL